MARARGPRPNRNQPAKRLQALPTLTEELSFDGSPLPGKTEGDKQLEGGAASASLGKIRATQRMVSPGCSGVSIPGKVPYPGKTLPLTNVTCCPFLKALFLTPGNSWAPVLSPPVFASEGYSKSIQTRAQRGEEIEGLMI